MKSLREAPVQAHRPLVVAAGIALSLVLVAAATPAPPESFPFVIPWDDVAPGSAVDVSALGPAEAGANGRIVVRGSVFVEEKTGKRVRFLATNLGARAAFPAREDADRIAARMARLGINLVRLHHLQNGWEKDGGTIWKPGKPFFEVDPKQVDTLDYLIAALKRHGIYTNLNLTTTREYLPEHGFPESVRDIPFTHHKKVDKFDRRMIALQKDYARSLLDHVNPYTGLAYREEPALAFVEINNENSLVGWPHESAGQGTDALPEPFRAQLVLLWNTWLAGRYGDDAALARAWSGEVTPLGEDVLASGTAWVFENQARPEAASAEVKGSAVRIVVGEALGGEWLAQGLLGPLTLENGAPYTLTFRARADRDRTIGLKVHLDRPDWRDHGLVAQARLGTAWREYSFSFPAKGPEPGHSRIAFMAGGPEATVEIDSVRLRRGTAPWTPPPGETLVRRNLSLATDASTGRRARDWKQFLLETEKAFAEEMRAFLRDELGIRASIIDSQVQWGGLTALEREASMEFADAHAYWAHPEFHGRSWDPLNWTVKREAHVDVLDRGQGVLADLALHRVAGRPYTVSEYNHPAPSDFRAEMMPLAMAVAGLQDWDALYTFAYPPTGKGEENDAIGGFFDTGLDVTKAAFHPSTAVQFRLGLVPPLAAEDRLALAPRPWERMKNAGEAWAATGGMPDILKTRVSMGVADVTADGRRPSGAAGSPSFFRRNARGAVWGVDTPAYKAVAGFVGGETLVLGEATLAFPAFGEKAEGFAAATLVDLEGRGLATARRALLTLVGRVDNTGMGWNAERTSVGDRWGRGPMQAEGVPCVVSLKLARRLDVWALDGSGRRREKMDTRWSGGVLSFDAGPRWKTVWYELADPAYRPPAAAAPAPAARLDRFRPGARWPDDKGVHINAHGGGILDYGGRYYWFGEHKVAGEAGNAAHVGVRCYSSADLYNWKDEGIALPVVKDVPGHDLVPGSIIERPKVIHNRRTGKFVMWFHLEPKGGGYAGARTGVAVADRVTGPYAYRGSFRPNAGAWPRHARPEDKVKLDLSGRAFSGGSLPDAPERLNLLARDFEGGQMARDQTLFVDDDGTAYHVYASEENSTLHISRLTDDYLAPAGDYVRVFPGRFMEAPAMFKHEGRYYLVLSGCTGWAPNAARSAVADSIWGPWTELGNPAVGPGAERTFDAQSTYVLPVRGRPGAFVFMADRWQPRDAIDGRYVWLPVLFRNGRVELEWRDEWDLGVFGR